MKFRQRIYRHVEVQSNIKQRTFLVAVKFASLPDHDNLIDYDLTVNRLVLGEIIQFETPEQNKVMQL